MTRTNGHSTVVSAAEGWRWHSGSAVIVGLHAATMDVPISPASLVLQNNRLLGSFVGSIRPQLDLPRLVALYRASRLQLDDLITKRYELGNVQQAFADMEAGTNGRGVVLFH